MKRTSKLKLYTLGELLALPPRKTHIRVTKSRQALTLRFGRFKHFPYDIALASLKTEQQILKWTLHLAGKQWITRQQLEDFMEAALEAAGINIHQSIDPPLPYSQLSTHHNPSSLSKS